MCFSCEIQKGVSAARLRKDSVRNVFSPCAKGMTLVELLVVLAIIATLAGLIYPAIMDSIRKSEASMAAQRIDAVEKMCLSIKKVRTEALWVNFQAAELP